jgi:hypothetical protein
VRAFFIAGDTAEGLTFNLGALNSDLWLSFNGARIHKVNIMITATMMPMIIVIILWVMRVSTPALLLTVCQKKNSVIL